VCVCVCFKAVSTAIVLEKVCVCVCVCVYDFVVENHTRTNLSDDLECSALHVAV